MEQKPEKKKRRFGFLAAWGVIGGLCLCLFLFFVVFSPDNNDPESVPVADSPIETARPEATALPSEAPGTEAPLAGSLGEKYESGGIALTVLDAYLTKRIGSFSDAQEGYVYLVLEVVLENVDRDEAPYNPLYFSVKDGEGFEYDPTFISPDPSLKSGTAAKGELARGFVAFEVKEGASGLVASYEPLVLFGGYETIRVALPEALELR